jgi:hypothetical protein
MVVETSNEIPVYVIPQGKLAIFYVAVVATNLLLD